jgi:hypothetical protein
MPLPVIPGCVRVVVAGLIAGGTRWANTWAIRTDSEIDPDAAGVQAIHEIFRQFYIGPNLGAGGNVMDFVAPATTLEGFAYTPLDGTSGALFFAEPTIGAGTGEPLPAQNAEVLTIRTATRGRRNRGRVFLPAVTENSSGAAGHISPTLVAFWLAQVAAVQAALVTGGARIGVLSVGPYIDPATQLPVPPGAATTALQHFTPATQFTMDDVFDVIRNRKA